MLRLYGIAILGLLLLPLIYTLFVSFSSKSLLALSVDQWSLRWYQEFFASPRFPTALLRSVIIATLSGILSVSLATPAALSLTKSHSRSAMEWMLLLPTCLPSVAIGMGLLPLFYFTGLWGSVTGIVLVHALLGIPIAYLIVRSNVTTQMQELAMAARGLGASRWHAWWRVTFPLLRPAMMAATLAVGVLSLNESFVTLFVATPKSETLPAVIWPQLRYAATPIIASASIITTIVSLMAIVFIYVCLKWNPISKK